MRLKLFLVLFVLLLSFSISLASPLNLLPAVNLTVNSSLDKPDTNPGNGVCDSDAAIAGAQCTLRAAIMEANKRAAGSVITLPAGIFNIAGPGTTDKTGDYDVRQSMTIRGGGLERTTINAAGHDRAFDIHENIGVDFKFLKIINGLTAEDAGGGGILVRAGSDIEVENILVADNTSLGANGGGGISLFPGAVNAFIHRSTITGNDSSNHGGGVGVFGGSVQLLNSTVSGNSAVGSGGGLYAWTTGNVAVNHSTVAYNNAGTSDIVVGEGGGVFNGDSSNHFSINSSIIAFNTADTGPDCNGSLDLQTNSIVKDTNGCIQIAGGVNEPFLTDDPQMTPDLVYVTEHDTLIHLLFVTSPAINLTDGYCPTVDQLGFPRQVFEGPCDSGAVEYFPLNRLIGDLSIDPATHHWDFEVGKETNPKMPVGWTGRLSSGNGRVCLGGRVAVGPASFLNRCAMRFTVANQINYVVPLDKVGAYSMNDKLLLYFRAAGKSLARGTASVKINVTYLGGATQTFSLAAAAGTYDFRQSVKAFLLTGDPIKIVVSLNFSGAAGTQVSFDAVQVYALPNPGPARADWLPLPPAP